MDEPTTKRWIERLRRLIDKGSALPVERGTTVGEYHPSGPFDEWRTQSIAALQDLFSEGHVYPRSFSEEVTAGYTSRAQTGLGILRAALEDVEAGYLRSLVALVTADVFSDFLDIAAHLLDAGYKDPAASLVGAVLEDGLRRIARSKDITVKSKDDLGSLNARLADANVYSRLVQKRVQVWNDLRNLADHGQFADYAERDVREMCAGVHGFLTDHHLA